MASHQFTLIVASTPTAEQASALVGLDDHPLVRRRPREGVGRVLFDRHRPDLADAVVSAVRDVEAVGLRPVRLVSDDWVTMADMAARVGRSRESVRLWSLGRVGPGSFPPPLNPDRDTSFYSWVEVSAWLRDRFVADHPEPEPTLAAMSLALQLRQLTPRLTRIDAIHDLLTPAAYPCAGGLLGRERVEDLLPEPGQLVLADAAHRAQGGQV